MNRSTSAPSRTLWTLYYLLRDAREGTSRNALAAIAVVLMIALAVGFTGSVALTARGTESLTSLLRHQARMRVLLTSSADPSVLTHRIQEMPGVRSVTFVSKQAELDRMERAFTGQVDLRAVFTDNPFPNGLDVLLSSPGRAEANASSISALPGVERVVYGQQYIRPLLRLAGTLKRTGWLAALLFGLVALLVSAVTWRLAILHRAAEVRTKQLMGVRPIVIHGQFVAEGALLGLLGGTLAAVVLVYVPGAFVDNVLTLLPIAGAHQAPYGLLAAGCLAAGLLLGSIGAISAIGAVARTAGAPT
jgi:cell division transport system permease protein